MEIDPTKSEGRVSEESYSELPEGHRTTLVVGMLDMLGCMAKYLDLNAQNAFEPIYKYAAEHESGKLRLMFDDFLKTKNSENIAIASSFFSMLIEKSQANRN